MDLGERARRGIAHVLYPIAHSVRHIDVYMNGPVNERGLTETFLADVARGMYSTLSRCGIRDPIMSKVLDEVSADEDRQRQIPSE